MRLIDADVLLEHIKKLECHAENKKYEQGLNDFLQCYFPKIIDKQPTAFDTEKVVEQLEVLHDLVNDNQKLAVSQSIDIVKKGGVE